MSGPRPTTGSAEPFTSRSRRRGPQSPERGFRSVPTVVTLGATGQGVRHECTSQSSHVTTRCPEGATAHFAPPILTSGLPYCVPRRGGETRARVWDDLPPSSRSHHSPRIQPPHELLALGYVRVNLREILGTIHKNRSMQFQPGVTALACANRLSLIESCPQSAHALQAAFFRIRRFENLRSRETTR